jgi:hypothetical protein
LERYFARGREVDNIKECIDGLDVSNFEIKRWREGKVYRNLEIIYAKKQKIV